MQVETVPAPWLTGITMMTGRRYQEKLISNLLGWRQSSSGDTGTDLVETLLSYYWLFDISDLYPFVPDLYD